MVTILLLFQTNLNIISSFLSTNKLIFPYFFLIVSVRMYTEPRMMTLTAKFYCTEIELSEVCYKFNYLRHL